jgi:hypothetical protein
MDFLLPQGALAPRPARPSFSDSPPRMQGAPAAAGALFGVEIR